jgi:hypothetical protein
LQSQPSRAGALDAPVTPHWTVSGQSVDLPLSQCLLAVLTVRVSPSSTLDGKLPVGEPIDQMQHTRSSFVIVINKPTSRAHAAAAERCRKAAAAAP